MEDEMSEQVLATTEWFDADGEELSEWVYGTEIDTGVELFGNKPPQQGSSSGGVMSGDFDFML
jgi:hypothetical protein